MTELLTLPFVRSGALDPPDKFAELRNNRPIAPVLTPGGGRAVLLTRHVDVSTALTDPRFSRDLNRPDVPQLTVSGDDRVFGRGEEDVLGLVTADGHARWRSLVFRSFTVRRVERLRAVVQRATDECVDYMLASARPVDLVEVLAFPVPIRMICTMLGVPEADQATFRRWTEHLLTLDGHTEEDVAAALGEFAGYLGRTLADKRERPTNDLFSALIHASDGERLTDAELIYTAQALLAAGHESTANMIGKLIGTILAGDRWPDLVGAGPELIAGAVEEGLRLDAMTDFGPVRYATENVELSTGTVRRGTTVLLSHTAANRDAAVFGDPDAFDPARRHNPHLAFSGGPHYCIGAALARMELRVVLETLMRRLPGLRLAVPADQLVAREGLISGALARLPVTW